MPKKPSSPILRNPAEPLILIRDTREHTGYLFSAIEPRPTVEVAGLKTGDYSVKGMEHLVAVERKTLEDAYGTFGRGRKRFERELSRMTQMQYACVVIEAAWGALLRGPSRSAMSPRAVFASIVAWQQRYGVHFWICETRAFGEKATYRILERFFHDQCRKR